MKYQPITCVWEVTMGCNMRCKHCGSSCSEPLPDELSTDEALEVCNQLADIGLKWVSISGGEPLTRKDLPAIVKYLTQLGVSVNLITNGWELDMETAAVLKRSGISTVAISIDGTEEIHDQIRRKGSFERSTQAFAALKANGISRGAITTITKQNIGQLEQLKEKLIEIGAQSWQVQLGLPMGNLKERPDWVLEPEQINDVIDFCFKTAQEGRIKIYPADCIGYYTNKESIIKRYAYETNNVSVWNGCNAGVLGFGLLHNGDILGCTSIRSKEFIEGNIKERPLREIWEGENAFSWRRNMKKSQLSGKCRTCTYGSKCLGGCPNTRMTMNGSIYEENEYCAYHLAMKNFEVKYANETNASKLFIHAENLIRQDNYQEASYALNRVIEIQPENIDAYNAKGFCEYMCGNYDACKELNEKALQIEEGNVYAMRGYGIAVYKLGNKKEGVQILRKAAELTGWQDQDLINDLHIMEQYK